MFTYAISINHTDRSIVIDDRATHTEYVFTEGKNPYEHSVHLCCNEYDFDDVVQIDAPMYETDVDPIGVGCPYDIHDFESFAAGLEATFGKEVA